jgi:legumain
VCHAYQVLIQHGVSADNIVTMAYDDIANNDQNPFPGALYNQPGDNPPNVYEGCKIDYKGGDVNPDNFLAILKGDKSGVSGGNGRVLESTKEDNVFINFVDHGAPGLIAFPVQYLYADTLLSTLSDMEKLGKYK